MKKVASVEDYIDGHANFKEALLTLRKLLLQTELEETIKWNAPVYALNGKNVLGLAAFKNHFGIWFFNGVFLNDPNNLLSNAQEGKTKAMRQMRFESIVDIDEAIILKYINEAIGNQKLGKELKPQKTDKAAIIPQELQELISTEAAFKSSFETLSPYKQREYCEYISAAKRETTKQSRLQKIKPMILEGIGLNDKYKNC